MQDFKHAHIIKYFHSFIDDSYFYILMEYAAGGEIHRASEKQLWKWAYEIILALEYLHSNYVIH